MNVVLSSGVAFLLALFAAGCGEETESRTPTFPSPPAQSLTLTCPAPVTIRTVSRSPQAVTYDQPQSRGGTAPVRITCTPSSGSAFPIGRTTVACQATDAAGRSASCSFDVVVELVARLSRTKILAFGDSVTAGEVTVPASTASGGPGHHVRFVLVPEASYPEQLRKLLVVRYPDQATDIRVINAGLSRESAVDGARRFPGVLRDSGADVVILLEGYNDLNALGASAISRAASAIQSMAKEARFRGARVFIASLTPPRPGGRSAIPADVVIAYNERLRDIARGEAAVFIDLYTPMLGNVNALIGVDGLHPTEQGYVTMATTIMGALVAELEER